MVSGMPGGSWMYEAGPVAMSRTPLTRGSVGPSPQARVKSSRPSQARPRRPQRCRRIRAPRRCRRETRFWESGGGARILPIAGPDGNARNNLQLLRERDLLVREGSSGLYADKCGPSRAWDSEAERLTKLLGP